MKTTTLVVGADRGIAHAICLQLRARGDVVHAACLGDAPALTAAGVTVLSGVDVTSDAAVAALARQFSEGQVLIERLYNVAGVLGLDELGRIDFDEMRRQFEINTLGPLRVVQAMLPHFAPAAKVGIVTSRVGSLGDNGSGGMYAYRVSKCAANMVGLNLHHDLSRRGIAVLLLHPGMVATALTKDFPGNHSYIQPEEAAAGLIRNLDQLTLETSGRFQHANGQYLPW